MSEVWNILIDICDDFINQFDRTGEEIAESGMERFNQPGWVNRVWTSSKYRRAHVDVVDARDTKGLWMMHTCVFPHLDNTGPIFGFDVIAGKNKITGCFHDWSATQQSDHPMIEHFGNEAETLEWTKKRELPEWAQAIFSKHMVSAGNVKDSSELAQIKDLAQNSIYAYIDEIAEFNGLGDIAKGKDAQNRYAYYQKQNPHTPRTMAALGLPDKDVEVFIEDCLFPFIE